MFRQPAIWAIAAALALVPPSGLTAEVGRFTIVPASQGWPMPMLLDTQTGQTWVLAIEQGRQGAWAPIGFLLAMPGAESARVADSLTPPPLAEMERLRRETVDAQTRRYMENLLEIVRNEERIFQQYAERSVRPNATEIELELPGGRRVRVPAGMTPDQLRSRLREQGFISAPRN